MISRTKEWVKTRIGKVVMGTVGILLAYFFAARAIDTGSLWQYFGTIVFLVFSFKLIFRAIRNR